MDKTNVISFEEGWPVLQEAIDNLIGNFEGLHTHEFTSQEYMNIYTTVYNMCVPNHFGPVPRKLYDLYKLTIEDYTTSKVLPVLRGKKDEMLLQEVVKRWKNHKVLTRWLSRFLHYLERYFITSKKLPTLKAASYLIFHNLVYGELNDQVRDAVLLMINREREGEQIDRTLVKESLDIYVEMDEESMKYYERDFEEAMLKSTASFYSGIALNWITSYSYEDYMLKVEECLKKEKEKNYCYLKGSSQNEPLEVLQQELFALYACKVEEKKQLDGKAA
ncbi:hypothetical protein LguiB_025668 [Lonicera macranthoides]